MKKYNLGLSDISCNRTELAQASTGKFTMLLCKDGKVSAPNFRNLFQNEVLY